MTLLLLAIAWLVGIGVAALGVAWLWPPLLVGLGAGVSAFLVMGRRREALTMLALGAVALLGLWRFEVTKTPAHPGGVAAMTSSKSVTLRGTVVEAPEQRERSQRIVLEVDAYRAGDSWQPTDGKVLVTARQFPRFDYGDVLELRGPLSLPPRFDDFDYSAYLARGGIGAVASFPGLKRTGTDGGSAWRRRLNSLRSSMDAALAKALPEPESALARGILLGSRSAIPADLTDDLNRAGISHLIAISGYNVTLVAAFIVAMLALLIGRRQALLVAMLFVPLFALFVGGGGSVLRAAVMGEVMLGASLAGRPGSALNAVVLAGAVLTVLRPVIIQDVSFQMSFAATLGIVLAAKPLSERFESVLSRVVPPIAAPLAESAGVTIAASLAVLPVMAATFGRVSFVALVPANLAAVWAFPLMMLGAAIAAFAGMISEPLGALAGDVAYVPLWYLVQVARLGARLPHASMSVDGVGLVGATVGYVALAALGIVLLRTRTSVVREESKPGLSRFRLRPGLATALVMLGAAAWLGRGQLVAASPGRLTVSVLDVGQGDATLIETPSGLRILIDGGPSGDRLLQALGKELSPSQRRFDLVVLSDAREEHASGLVSIVQRFEVGAVLTTPVPGTSAAYRELTVVLQSKGIAVTEATAGQWLDLGDGARLEVVSPGADPRGTDANPLVLRLVHGRSSVLLAGALEPADEDDLLASGSDLRAIALVLPRHGTDAKSTDDFVSAVTPRLALISVGDNAFGLPSPSTELLLAGLPELRTDRNGRVRLRFEPDGLAVDFDRGSLRQVDAAPK